MTEHTADATFMTIREIVKEMREEQRKFNDSLQKIRDEMVTKAEFKEFQNEALVTKRWKVGTTLSILTLVLSMIGLLVLVL